ncbi:ATP-dependent carboxylate-amine ligase [Sphaerisporangium album]|uniref:ATP-dependent carboxylate-amine ligase n=1 Tax=Sphaerisporangium album TaxID=509200 RepID=A0A367F0B8_9ACTN|nr:ATP-dependent carboxylate-amine ligase [Sphaerisporangium album]RCG23409.1 ATP-dependent carboxylate-amine ligase [Sphaerisporangium album]
MSSTVLILTEDDDAQARHVARALAGRGADALVLEPGRFPGLARLSVTLDHSGAARRVLLTAGRRLDLDGLTSVWFRRSEPPGEGAVQQQDGFASDVWDTLACAAVPASRPVIHRARRKLYQLSVAGRAGFALPSTLISTDHEELLDFYLAHHGQIVTRVLDHPWAIGDPAPEEEPGALTDPAGTGPFPLVAQERVLRRLALRIIVSGSRVFAAEIHSPRSSRRLRPHDLPDDVRGRCLGVMADLGLSFGTIDLTLTPEDRYVFLEVNPGGGFLLIEEITGMPITDALCDLLLTDTPERRLPGPGYSGRG